MSKTRLNSRRVNYFTTILQCERTQVLSILLQSMPQWNKPQVPRASSKYFLFEAPKSCYTDLKWSNKLRNLAGNSSHQITSTNSQETLCGPTSLELKVNQTHWNTYGSAHQISLIRIEKSPFSQSRKGKARLKLLQPATENSKEGKAKQRTNKQKQDESSMNNSASFTAVQEPSTVACMMDQHTK